MDGGSENPNVRTFFASNPGFTFHSAVKVRIISPAPTSKTSASAISAATSARCTRWRVPLPPRPPSLRARCAVAFVVLNAGISPKQIPASNEIAAAKIRTRPSIPASEERGSVIGSTRNAAFVPLAASSTPSPPPIAASKMLSVSSCRRIRPWPAPRALRIANSCVRAIERASRRLATFTQAISSTNPTAPNNNSRNGFTCASMLLRIGAAVIPMRKSMLAQVKPFLLLLFGAVGFVLLIACVNVANLLLARSIARTHEFAIRRALGAGHGRILRQLLTESILLAAIGGGLGVLLAASGTKAALRVLPMTLPRSSEAGMDGRVLIFAAAISLLAGICFGLMPALKTTKAKAHLALKEGGRGGSGTRHRVQRALVAAEMALALVLLIGAGLMIRTLAALWNVNPGFDAQNVLTFGFSLPPSMTQATPDAVRTALREVHEKFQSAPGVQAVSFSWGALPLASDDQWLFWIDGQPKPASENDMNWALNYVVEPDYLEVMSIPLKSGRFFTSRDDERAQKVAVIDDALAGKFFGNADPIGRRLHINSSDQLVEIVGVVGHVKQWGLDTDDKESLRAQLYTPFMQLPEKAMAQSASGIGVLARSQNSAPVFESLRRASERMSHQQVVFGAQTINEIIAKSVAARRFAMILLGIFAGLALMLASIGIYGVVSYVVGQRTQEIGVRIAMGAQRSEVLRLVLAQGAAMAALGAAVGLVAALGLTRLMGTMLYAISAADPLTYLCVTMLLFAVSMAACWLPARRAAGINPVDALRHE